MNRPKEIFSVVCYVLTYTFESVFASILVIVSVDSIHYFLYIGRRGGGGLTPFQLYDLSLLPHKYPMKYILTNFTK